MIRDAVLAKTMASELLERGLLVTALAYPVVPKGSTRIRLQVSLSHSQEQIEAAVHAFKVVGQKLGMVP
jgi:glycine C-acetyltransferase